MGWRYDGEPLIRIAAVCIELYWIELHEREDVLGEWYRIASIHELMLDTFVLHAPCVFSSKSQLSSKTKEAEGRSFDRQPCLGMNVTIVE